MPTQGQILNNPVTGDSHEYLETAKDTNGQRVTVKSTIRTKGQLVPRHLHVLQDESFEVISGQLTILLDEGTRTLSAGEKVILPRNTPHNHYNDGDSAVTYIHSVSPALDFDYLLENLAGLAADGKSKDGKYGLVQQLMFLKYLDGKTYLADLPVGVQQILMNVVAPIGRLLGYRAIYRRYSDIEK